MIRLASRLSLTAFICGSFMNSPLNAMIEGDVEKAATTPLASTTHDGVTETPQQRAKKRIRKRITRKDDSAPQSQSTQTRSAQNTEPLTSPPRTAKQILGVLKLRLFTQDISEEDEKQILQGLEAKSPEDRESFDTFFDVDLLPLFVADQISDEGFYLKLLHAMACSKKTNTELLSRAKNIKAILKHNQSEFFVHVLERPFTVGQMKALFDMTIKIQSPYKLGNIQTETPRPGPLKRLFSKLKPARSAPPETSSLSPEEACRLERQKAELLFQNWGGAYCREADYVRLFDALETKTPDQIKSMGSALSDAVFAITSISPHVKINEVLVELVTLPEDDISGLVKLINSKSPFFDKSPYEKTRRGDRYNPSAGPTNFMLTQIRFWKEAHQSPEGIMGAAE